jgi:hypothetical protein
MNLHESDLLEIDVLGSCFPNYMGNSHWWLSEELHHGRGSGFVRPRAIRRSLVGGSTSDLDWVKLLVWKIRR